MREAKGGETERVTHLYSNKKKKEEEKSHIKISISSTGFYQRAALQDKGSTQNVRPLEEIIVGQIKNRHNVEPLIFPPPTRY